MVLFFCKSILNLKENETENGAIFIDAQPGDLTIAIHLISKQETH